MRRRVVGIETEYGLTAAPTTGAASTMDADQAARRLFDPLLSRGRSSNLFLRNGGRLYLDVGSHPEYATAECDRLDDLLAQDRAGSLMLADLAARADETLEAEGRDERLHLFRNNLDSHGHSYGCHENYLLHRRRDFRQVADALVAFFITRQILVGNGWIKHGPAGASLCFSQRGDQMWDAVSSATTRSRPIINTRDEPLADSGSYRRMHVIVGDTNVCEATTALKIGMTEMLLTALEDGLRIEDLALADPMRAIREINADLSAGTRLDLADGRTMTPVAVQREVRDRVVRTVGADGLDDLHAYVLDLWERGLDALESGDWTGVETELDIAIKRRLLESYAARQGVGLADPRVARLDLSYHDITGDGLLERMERAGLVKRLTSPQRVAQATGEPPATTRAALRGRIIAAAEDARVDLTADWVHVRLDDRSAVPLSLQDPLACEDPRVDALIAAIGRSTTELPA
ncbi:Pup--protein ligase [Actinomyces sp. B33]|uniref:Pup--protein ligase n=1 Tax=Actinomyces sp. B33 TaxID=2942131 RepID=UPI002340A609|nr:Pup--protein ligase [Actinomyces sp. B33]MDC4233352.1 Pup--protein ligase [Actinomyces sp. B33]